MSRLVGEATLGRTLTAATLAAILAAAGCTKSPATFQKPEGGVVEYTFVRDGKVFARLAACAIDPDGSLSLLTQLELQQIGSGEIPPDTFDLTSAGSVPRSDGTEGPDVACGYNLGLPYTEEEHVAGRTAGELGKYYPIPSGLPDPTEVNRHP